MTWPPLVGTASLPGWVVVRDVLLTLLAWLLLLYFLRDLVWMAAYWGLAALQVRIPPRWQSGEMWRDTLPFLGVVGLLVLWLAVFAIARWRLLTNRLRSATEPASLDVVSQADAFGLPITSVDQLRAACLATVYLSDAAVDDSGWNLVMVIHAQDDR